MFGDGRGYAVAAIITDVCAVVTTAPPWMVAYAADFSRFATGFQILPLAQLAAGPALHLFRVVSPSGDRENGLGAGTALLLGGGTVMTIVDALLARARPTATEPQVSWMPSIRPMSGGVVAGLAAAW